MNWTIAFQVARFVIWLVLNIRTLVNQAEQELPESGRGSDKFAAVKEAVTVAASVAGMADAAIKAVQPLVESKINEAVAVEINGKK